MSSKQGFLSRDELLGGLPARRATSLLFAIESRTAHLALQSQQAASRFISERTAAQQEQAFFSALAQGRNSKPPSIQAIERYAPQWSELVPPDVDLRAALARLFAEKYRFTARVAPALRAALGLDDAAVQQAYQRLHGKPLATLYAPQLSRREQLRWATAGVATRLENLSPFWTAFALTLTEMVGASILALPIALAGVGPLAGAALLVVLGLINIVTIVGVSEAVARNGRVRYGRAYFGGVVSDLLGSAGALVLSPSLLILNVLCLLIYYVGLSTTIAAATGVPAPVWAGLLFLVQISFLRRESLSATIASALIVGFTNIGLLVFMSFLAIPFLNTANLTYVNVPFVNGRPFDPSILALIFGVIIAAYFGHLSTGSCARLVMRRDPSGRALIWGNIAAVSTAIVLYTLWVIVVNGAIAPATLLAESGTALTPLAAKVGPVVTILGLAFAILSMGMASIHFALALFNQVREWIPASMTNSQASFIAGLAPVVAIFALVEWQLLTGQESFAGLFWSLALIVPLVGGIFPMLMLASSRRKGEYAPSAAINWLGHPIIVGGTFVLFIVSVFAHGLFIWQDPFQRVIALAVGIIMVGMTLVVAQRGAFTPRAILEFLVERPAEKRAMFQVIANGKPLSAHVCWVLKDREQQMTASVGEISLVHSPASITLRLPVTPARELKVWAHQLSPEGVSEKLAAQLEVRTGEFGKNFDLTTEGQALVPLDGEPCDVKLTLSKLYGKES